MVLCNVGSYQQKKYTFLDFLAKVFGQIALMSLSTYKSHYLVIDKDILNKFVEFDDKNFHDVHEQMLFGITINKDLSLQGYTESIL